MPIDYSRAADELAAQRDSRMQSSRELGAQVPPERAAAAIEDARRLGLTPDTILETGATGPDKYADRIRQRPGLASWVAKSTVNGSLSHGEEEDLIRANDYYTTIPGAHEQGRAMIDIIPYRRAQWQAVLGLRDDDLTKEQLSEADRLSGVLNQPGVDIRLNNMAEWVPQELVKQAPIMAHVLGESLEGGVAGAATGAVVGAAAGAAGGPAATVTAGAGATAGFVAGSRTMAFRASFDLEAALAYDEFIKIPDFDPETAAYAAVAVGTVNGALEAFLGVESLIPGAGPIARMWSRGVVKAALKTAPTRAAIVGLGKAMMKTAAVEGVTEMAQGVAPDIGKAILELEASGEQIDYSTVISKVFTEENISGWIKEGLVGAVTGGAYGGAVHGAVNTMPELVAARRAKATEKRILAAGQHLAGKRATPEYLGESVKDEVYIDADAFVGYFAQKGIDPDQVAREIWGSEKPLADAASGSGLLRISLGDYARTLGKTEHNQFFAREIREEPDAWNGREADNYQKVMSDRFESNEQQQKVIDDATEKLKGGLIAAGYDEKQAADLSAIRARQVASIAAATNKTVDEVIAERGLNVGRFQISPDGKIEPILGQSGTGPGAVVDGLAEHGEFKTGNPITFDYMRNTEKAPRPGPDDQFAQKIEPAGRYMTPKEGEPTGLETGSVTFNNPLVIEFGEGLYADDTNWKRRLSKAYGGKKGAALSRAIADSGHDGIVTISKLKSGEQYVSEVVDLAGAGFAPAAQSLFQDSFDQPDGYTFTESDYRDTVVSWAKDRFGESIAPNGKPQWQNFVRWFGESAVVDGAGNPMVVYHGTTSDVATLNTPSFFTDEVDAANFYAEDFRGEMEFVDNPNGVTIGANVVPVYLSINNPLSVFDKVGAKKLVDIARRAGADITFTEVGAGWDFETDEIGMHSDYDGMNINDLIYSPRVREQMKKEGFDGLIAWDVLENTEIKAFIPLERTQIKSSTGNTGDYSAGDPSILMQAGRGRIEIGAYETLRGKDGSITVFGDPDKIRAELPDSIKGRSTDGGLKFTHVAAPRVIAALDGGKIAYSRAGAVLKKKPMKGGKYVGAPEKFDTPAKIPHLRKWMNQLALEGAPGRHWYERSGEAILRMVGGDVTEARKFVALLAIYSPQAKVDANSTFALRAWAQYKAGQPIAVKTGSQDTKAQEALEDVDKFWSGEKTGNFFFNLLRMIDPSTEGKQGATIDMWMMRAAQYAHDAPTSTEYSFMEDETNRIAEEFGWEPQQVQAAIWVAMKARMENPQVKKDTEASSEKKGWIHYEYSPKRTRVVDNEEKHRANWLKHAFEHDPTTDDTLQAKFDFGDGVSRHIGQLSFEARPGRTTGALPGIHSAPYEQQAEFQRAIDAAFLEEDGSDRLAQMLGLLVDTNDILLPGVWQGEVSPSSQKLVAMAPAGAGVMVFDLRDPDNPARISTREADAIDPDWKKKKDRFRTVAAIDPAQVEALSLYAAVKGLVGRQEGVGWHKPFFTTTKKEANGLDIRIGRPLTPAETIALEWAIGNWMAGKGLENWQDKMALVSSPEGIRVLNFGLVENDVLHKDIVAVAESALPDFSHVAFASDGDMVSNKWEENPNGESYRLRLSEAGRSDVLDWARDVLAPRVQAVYEDFSARYGWGEPGSVEIPAGQVAPPDLTNTLVRVGDAGVLLQSAFHGGPYRFSKFSLDHIGKGEGAQAFGYGLYFSGRREIGEYYRKNLSGRATAKELRAVIAALPARYKGTDNAKQIFTDIYNALKVGDISAAADYLNEYTVQPDMVPAYKAAASMYQEGQLYEVDIPEDADMLQWDKPLSEQPEGLLEKLRSFQDVHVAVKNALNDPTVTTGGGFYRTLATALFDESGKEASARLNNLGIPGISYPAESLSGGKGDSRNFVIFDDSAIEILNTFYQDEVGPRGFYVPSTKGGKAQLDIGLLAGADVSTVLHETSHGYLRIMREVVRDMIARSEQGETLSPSEMKVIDDFEILSEWFQKHAQSGQALRELRAIAASRPDSVPHQVAVRMAEADPTLLEQVAIGFVASPDPLIQSALETPREEYYARGFEAYVMEGNAPSIALRKIFYRIKIWMLTIYKSAKDLNVTLNADVRGVFDRMLATDEEIAAARGEVRPLLSDAKTAGMTEKQFDAYKGLIERAHEEAATDLGVQMLREWKRERETWWKEETAKERDAAEAELAAQRPYAALKTMRDNLSRISREFIRENYPDLEASLDAHGLLRIKDSVSPDEVAELLGYQSGDQMVKELAQTRPLRQAAQEIADARMKAKHGNLFEDAPQRAQAAQEAVLGEAQAKVLEAEMQALARLQRTLEPARKAAAAEARAGRSQALAMIRGTPPFSAFVQMAEGRVSQMTQRELAPGQYLVAMRRAGEASRRALIAGDPMTAAVQKQAEAMNLALYQAVTKAKKEFDKQVRFARDLGSTKARKRLGKVGGGYLQQISHILDRFDFAPVTLRALDRRQKEDLYRQQTLQQWIEEQAELGNIIELPDEVMDTSWAKSWREMTVDEMQTVYQSLKHLDHLARYKDRLLKVREKAELAATVSNLIAVAEKNYRGKERLEIETDLPVERVKSFGRRILLAHRKAASLVRHADGETLGAWWQTFIEPVHEAGVAQARMRAEATVKLKELMGDLFTTEPVKAKLNTLTLGKMNVGPFAKTFYPEINRSLSKHAVLAMALNWGADGNRQRLMDGYGWTKQQVEAVLAAGMTKKDWEMVQGIWDYLETFWPATKALSERVEGIAAEKIPPVQVVTPYGTFAGGYYPASYNQDLSFKSFMQTSADDIKAAMSGAVFKSTTKHGFRKARVTAVKDMQIRLSLDPLFQHVSDVIHDQTHFEVLTDLNKILRDPTLANAIIKMYGHEWLKEMRFYVESVAADDRSTRSNAIERAALYTRAGVSFAYMGFKFATAAVQITGYTQSMYRIRGWMWDGIKKFYSNPMKAIDEINGMSEFMKLRPMMQNRDISEIMGDIKGTSPLARYAFWMIVRMQQVVDYPTWWGAYQQALSQGMKDKRAIHYADQTVKDTQMGGQTGDLSRVMKDGVLLKMLTSFYSYGNTTFNLTAESLGRTDFTKPKDVGNMLLDMVILYTMPTVLMILLMDVLTPDGDDDDESFAEQVAREQLAMMLGSMVVLREFSGVAKGFGQYEGPASMRVLPATVDLVKQFGQAEFDEALFRAALEASGILLHYPSSQVDKTVRGIVAVAEGKTDGPIEAGQAIMMGPPRE